MTHSESINELAAALAAAQMEIENATKSSTNPHFKSKYADLAEVLNVVRPTFSRNGLAVTQCPSYESGIVSVETVLMHKSGQYIASTISAPVTKQDAQGVGSAITYCRRYALAAVAGVGQEDDDANSAVGGNGTKRPANSDPAAVHREHYATLKSELLAAQDAATVNELMTRRKGWLIGMPEKGRAELNALAMERRDKLAA